MGLGLAIGIDTGEELAAERFIASGSRVTFGVALTQFRCARGWRVRVLPRAAAQQK